MTNEEAIKKVSMVKMLAVKSSTDTAVAMDMAIEALKEQQPKVLSKEDIAKHDVVWMETYKDEIFPVLVNGATGNPKSKIHYYVHLYGVDGYIVGFPMFLYNCKWRCWTNRPTDSVRMNTPWNGGEQE